MGYTYKYLAWDWPSLADRFQTLADGIAEFGFTDQPAELAGELRNMADWLEAQDK